MNIIVQKFGGTSVGNIEKIKNVALKVKDEIEKGNKIIVVVSAMSGVTNQLVDYVSQISDLHNNDISAEYDHVVSSGEQVTSGLLAIALQNIGYKARSFCGWQIPINTSNHYSKSLILNINGDFLKEQLKFYDAIVIAGFQGINKEDNRITTMGRGGSDTSAVAIAASVNAKRCDIYTDVDGVYTTDPRITPKARKLNKISYEEVLEMAHTGAKVLQTRSVIMAMRHNVETRVLSTFVENSGTLLVSNDEIVDRRVLTGITCSKNEVMIILSKMPDHPGLSAKIFKKLNDKNISVDMIVQNISEDDGKSVDITFTTTSEEVSKAKMAMEEIKNVIKYEKLITKEDIAKLSIIGVGMVKSPGVACQMFTALAEHNINIHLISTSEIKISTIINLEYVELAIRVLHNIFNLEKSNSDKD